MLQTLTFELNYDLFKSDSSVIVYRNATIQLGPYFLFGCKSKTSDNTYT